MNNSDERDYEEEEANRRLLAEGDDPDPEDERREKTARVLQLLDEVYRANKAGNAEEAQARYVEACEIDDFCVTAVRGGIMIGQIPDPARDYGAWLDYLEAQRNG